MKRLILIFGLLLIFTGLEAQLIGRSPAVKVIPAAGTPSNMISNGTFDSGTGWTASAAWTISGGVASYATTASTNINQADGDMSESIQANIVYTLTLIMDNTTEGSGDGTFYIYNSDQSIMYLDVVTDGYPDGENIINFTTPANIGVGGIAIRGYMYGNDSFSIDNLVLTAD